MGKPSTDNYALGKARFVQGAPKRGVTQFPGRNSEYKSDKRNKTLALQHPGKWMWAADQKASSRVKIAQSVREIFNNQG